MSFIEIKHLRKEYGDSVPLKDVSIDIGKGEVIGIIGPSGTGKSTFLRCLNRLETPTSGSILIDGEDVCRPDADLAKLRRRMGMVFQSYNLFPHMMAAENIMRPLQSLLGVSAEDAYDEAMQQLARVGLDDKARLYPDELSGGQRQRVAIARALAMHPDIMLFDEPTSALDPGMVSEVISVMKDLSQTGLTMLTVTHDMRLAKEVSERVLYMDQGGIYEDAPAAKIFEDPSGERTRDFIFDIRSWRYTLSAKSRDMREMLGSLDDFCRRTYMSKKQAVNCRLAAEELAVSRLLTDIDAHPDHSFGVTVDYCEESGETKLLVSGSHLPEKGEPVSDAILADAAERLPDDEKGRAVFGIICPADEK